MIVVAGEALIDLKPNADGTLVPLPGGGPFTTARTIARLGAPVTFLGALSTDAYGRALRAALRDDGVDLASAPSVEAPTTLALAEPDGYRFYAAGTSAASLEHAALPPGTSALHVGSLGLVLEPTATTIERLALTAPPEVLVMADPNVRPALRGDRERLHRVLARADLVKCSVEDLEDLVPGADLVDAARRLGRATVVTRGGEGAVVVTADSVVEIPPVPVDVVDTIGAGDAFGGALLVGLAGGPVDAERLRAAAELAVRVAALTCARAGASPPGAAEVGLHRPAASG